MIDNHGGQSPVPYYGLFYSQSYQEQYVQFKKIAEFERQDILESLFWGDKGLAKARATNKGVPMETFRNVLTNKWAILFAALVLALLIYHAPRVAYSLPFI